MQIISVSPVLSMLLHSVLLSAIKWGYFSPPPPYPLHPHPFPFSQSLISLLVSVDVKHHVYLLYLLTTQILTPCMAHDATILYIGGGTMEYRSAMKHQTPDQKVVDLIPWQEWWESFLLQS